MSNQSNIVGIEQGRASFAYQCAIEGKSLGGKKATEYKSYTKKIPMMIKTNGLGATLAFVKSKSDKGNAYDIINNQLRNWFLKDPKQVVKLNPQEDFVKQIIGLNSFEYRAATMEILAFINWLRRFAEGLIEGEAGV